MEVYRRYVHVLIRLCSLGKERKITDSPAVIEGVLSHDQAPVNLCLRRFEKTLDIDFHFHIAIVRSWI